MTPRLAIVGGGRMGEALLTGLLESGWAEAGQIVVVEPIEARRRELARHHDGVVVVAAPESADGTVLAVKPGDAEGACRQVAAAGCDRVLSIMAGVCLGDLEKWLGATSRVVRAMPNTPALVGCGAAAIAGGSMTGEEDLDWAESILSATGIVVRTSEHLLDTVTGLSGSGPAYVFLMVEALIEAGVLGGLTRPVARSLVIQTVLGSARLLSETGEEPEALRAAVTSPGGTTAAGLRALEARAVRSAFLEAVAAATERSIQIGSG